MWHSNVNRYGQCMWHSNINWYGQCMWHIQWREMLAGFWWGNLKKKRPRGTSKRKWGDNIKFDLKETGWEGIHWIHLAQDKDMWWTLVNMVMNLQVPQNIGNLLSSFSRTQLFIKRSAWGSRWDSGLVWWTLVIGRVVPVVRLDCWQWVVPVVRLDYWQWVVPFVRMDYWHWRWRHNILWNTGNDSPTDTLSHARRPES